jgi:hypothetical protein
MMWLADQYAERVIFPILTRVYGFCLNVKAVLDLIWLTCVLFVLLGATIGGGYLLFKFAAWLIPLL